MRARWTCFKGIFGTGVGTVTGAVAVPATAQGRFVSVKKKALGDDQIPKAQQLVTSPSKSYSRKNCRLP